MELTWARGEGRRPRWPRDSQIISFHPLWGQASIRLTRNSPTPSFPSPSLPCRPTATVHRQKIISNRDTGADFSNTVDPNGSRANAWREIFFFSFFLVLSFCFFFSPRGRAVDGFRNRRRFRTVCSSLTRLHGVN